MTPVTMFYDNLCHFLWQFLCHFLSQKLRFKIPLSDSVAMFLIKLRWIFLLKIILNIIWFYYKIQLVCHIKFFRRKRNKNVRRNDVAGIPRATNTAPSKRHDIWKSGAVNLPTNLQSCSHGNKGRDFKNKTRPWNGSCVFKKFEDVYP